MNTAIVEALNPGQTADAMKLAAQVSRLADQAGRALQRLYASASNPVAGM